MFIHRFSLSGIARKGADSESELPPWIQVEEVSLKERAEIQLYKLVSLIPVLITFSLYIYITVFYIYVSFLPFNLGTVFSNASHILANLFNLCFF